MQPAESECAELEQGSVQASVEAASTPDTDNAVGAEDNGSVLDIVNALFDKNGKTIDIVGVNQLRLRACPTIQKTGCDS